MEITATLLHIVHGGLYGAPFTQNENKYTIDFDMT